MIYVCPEKDRQVLEPCQPCICGLDKKMIAPAAAPPPDFEMWWRNYWVTNGDVLQLSGTKYAKAAWTAAQAASAERIAELERERDDLRHMHHFQIESCEEHTSEMLMRVEEAESALSAEAAANAMLREAIETYLDAEWGDIIDEPPAEMLAWLELYRPDCKSDIALARAFAASPSSLTARVMALEAAEITAYMGELYAAAMHDLKSADPGEVDMHGMSIVGWRGAYLEGIRDTIAGIVTRVPDERRPQIEAAIKSAFEAHTAALTPSAAPGETEK